MTNTLPIDRSVYEALLGVLGAALLAGAGAIITRARYIHYQYIIIKIAWLWLLTGILAIWIEKEFTPNMFILFVPPLTFFTSHLSQLIENTFK